MFGECHAHLFMNGQNYRKAVEDHKNGVRDALLREHLQAYQDAGVTFVRDGGDRYGVSERAKKLAGEYGIDYRSPIFAIHWKGHYGGIVGKGVSSIEEYRILIDEVRERGGDFIKLMISGIMDYAGFSCLSEPALEADKIREMIHIAHEEGFAVMIHGNGKEAVLPALLAGADSLEHGNYIEEECLDVMAECGCVWVPTAITTKNLIGCGRYEDSILQKILEHQSANIVRAYEKGVCIAAGSDAGAYLVSHGNGIRQETELLQTLITDPDWKTYLRTGETCIKTKFKRK